MRLVLSLAVMLASVLLGGLVGFVAHHVGGTWLWVASFPLSFCSGLFGAKLAFLILDLGR